MPAQLLHLVRHGEVHNPDHILYGRLPNFGLSEAGAEMAQAAAKYVKTAGRTVSELRRSPLQRTGESARPFTDLFGRDAIIDERVIEPWNVFEGRQMRKALRNPLNWRYLLRPAQPSWGEPYAQIAARIRDAMDDLWDATTDGDAVIVSHQAPIWIAHLATVGEPLRHDPRTRRCALSSITTFSREAGEWTEVDYAEPARVDVATDVGAV